MMNTGNTDADRQLACSRAPAKRESLSQTDPKPPVLQVRAAATGSRLFPSSGWNR